MRRLTLALLAGAVLALAPTRALATAEAVFTSANHGSKRTVVADKIIAVMNKAKSSIKIAVAHFNSQQITDALVAIRKEKPELSIEVLLDMGEYRDKKSKATQLEAGAVPVRYKTYSFSFFHPQSQLMHHKFLIIDGKELVTGSYNWSDTAETKNYENVIHYFGGNVGPIVRDYLAEFEKLWGQNRDVFPDFVKALSAQPGEPGYKRIVPVHFNSEYFSGPMALVRDEVAQIRSAAAKMGFFADFGNIGRRFFDREAVAGVNDEPAGRFLGPDEPLQEVEARPTAGARPPTESVDAGAGLVGRLGETAAPEKPEADARKEDDE